MKSQHTQNAETRKRRLAACRSSPMPIQHEQYSVDRSTTETLAIALGWFSIALGVAELLAPRRVAGLIGASVNDGTASTIRAYGVREIASGVAILSQPDEPKWLWSRVGGDAVDLASLGAAAGHEAADPGRLCLAAAAVAGVTALDVVAALGLSTPSDAFADGSFDPTYEQAVTVKAPLESVEAAWMAWCASGRSKLRNNYAVRFELAPGARGTQVHLSGGGTSGKMRDELRRFKQQLETGEIPLSDGPGLSRPAQPRDADDLRTLAEVP